MDIQEMLAERAGRTGGCGDAAMPRFTLTHEGSLTIEHELLVGSGNDARGIPHAFDDAGELTAAALREFDGAIRDIRRRSRRQAVFEKVDGAIDPARPWDDFDRPPSWATLTHPLLSYALRMNGSNDLTGDAVADRLAPGKGVRFELIQDVIVGRCPLDPLHPGAGKVGCDARGANLLLEAEIPETTRHLLAGRALGALVQLRACGDAHLDAIVSAIPIVHVLPPVDGSPVVTVVMAPVPWVPPAPAPIGIDVSDLRRDAPIR
jgi:hypothetical protein